MDCKTVNLYTTSMSANELAACLRVKEVSSSHSSPYIGRYVSLLSEPNLSHRTRQDNPFLTPVQQVAKQIVELRPAPVSAVATLSNSALSRQSGYSSNKHSMNTVLSARKETGKLAEGCSLTTTGPSSRAISSYKPAIRNLCPQPESHPRDYSTLKIVSRLPSASDHVLRPTTTATAPYLLAPGGQYISQLVISRSSSQLNRPSTGSGSRVPSIRPASFSMSTSNSTTSCVSQTSQATHSSLVPLNTLENDELDARERELELELQRIQVERQARAVIKASAQLQKEPPDQTNNPLIDLPVRLSVPAEAAKSSASTRTIVESANIHTNDPLVSSLTALSRSSSRNVFLESYVAEETVRRCLQRSNMTGSQPLASHSGEDVCSSQASILTAVHLEQTNTEDRSSPQVAACALKRLISELLEHPRAMSPTADRSGTFTKQSVESQSESSSPYLNTYSARDYVTHEDVLSVFDEDNSLNFNRFKYLAKKFYGRISKAKLWSVAKEIDLMDSIDEKVDYLYSFLFNR
ncbi:hypothetical protein GL50803_004415 [Giardia duodenalis]|uniref:Uncharacterized protein n=1 Tax=Giardia intestinalis (strain ATCC 50803 / WB clone C6) TaxID=184922 RepID=A8BST7_GIAIC|nr:hypothetical protein GL50803_004415 [Giardia intestinalis]KAE8305538.1 hypothetical protein GL50803_004415 [Giardia intestinalis]|eukprot:XP_001705070.1 Hypothetical protein GL50803_4415 [Giardia lamblia ATCC 50803]